MPIGGQRDAGVVLAIRVPTGEGDAVPGAVAQQMMIDELATVVGVDALDRDWQFAPGTLQRRVRPAPRLVLEAAQIDPADIHVGDGGSRRTTLGGEHGARHHHQALAAHEVEHVPDLFQSLEHLLVVTPWSRAALAAPGASHE